MLRLQSEGRFSDRKELDPSRPNGLWIEGNTLWLRLNKRKHRQQGSILYSKCRCGEVNVCIKCLVEKFMHKVEVGQPLYSRPGQGLLVEVKRVLECIGCLEGSLYLS